MNYLSTLNERQLEAVCHTEGYLRVIAGAGSGKTKLLVSRYAYLVKEYGIDSANILCVTFTNKAAGEMKRRIKSLIGEDYDTSLICTYHGLCVRILREDVEKIFFPKEFQIIDNAMQKSIIEDIYQKFELKMDHACFEKVMRQISKFKAMHPEYVDKMCSRDKCQILDDIKNVDDRIVEEFLQKQKQVYGLDFQDLLNFTINIFNRCPDVLEKWQDRLNYIQVDEFQDSSGIEMCLVDMLSGKYGNLMIVGDPDQNIYEWRGSDVKLLVDFDKFHMPTKTIILNQNYRSTPQILSCANKLIENNEFRLKKDLFTQGADGVAVYHFHEKTEYAEADQIIATINQIRKEEKCNYADFAILYRSGFLSRVIEKKFTENGIPYEIFGGVKFYQRMEIQDIMAYLRLIAFDDDISFKRIVNKPRRRFGRTKMLHLLDLQQDGVSLFETLKSHIDEPIFLQSGAKEFVETISTIKKSYNSIPLSDTIEKVCTDSGYEKYIRELGDMERFDNLSEFKKIVSEYEKSFGEEVSLKEFINQISLQSEDDGEEASDMVKLMTIHSSKGLEFPYVFVVGFSEGIFPSAKSIEDRKKMGLEEERRLCYVAITRAEKRLFLLDSEGYTQNGKQKLPSRFLKEIGEENYVRIGVISKELQEGADKYANQLLGVVEENALKAIGEKVVHPVFGEGEIIGYGKNMNSYKIKFEKLNSDRDISCDFFNKISKQQPLQQENKLEEKQELKREPVDDYEKVDEIKTQSKVEKKQESQQEEKVEQEREKPVPKGKIKSGSESDNLWKRDDVPKTGWSCVEVIDMGESSAICEMCGHQIIRYVHHMTHPGYRDLYVGCICAGKMEGNIEAAKMREQEFKNKQSRKENFKNKKWKTSKNSNSYLKVKDHLIVLYYSKTNNNWKYSLDNVFCKEVYATREEVVEAAFEALENTKK